MNDHLTQVERAQTLGLKQATGSKLRLDVELPDGSHYVFTL
ncbi:hypothetical protein ABRP68_15725 [Pectobacterium aroidearum]